MKIGNVYINEQEAFLAPMAGITDLPFRSLCKKMGAALVYSEMVSAKGLFYNSKNTKSLLMTSEDEEPLVVQIFGSEPSIMAEMAKKLEQEGVQIIDVNMGCPAPKIVKNGEGSALMRSPLLIGKIIESISGAVSIPITIKMRSGFDCENINAVECAKIAEQSGAAVIAIHGRTRTQFYKGLADWNIIKNVKQAVKIPVIGNGDVVSGESARRMLDSTGCDAVMVGRASCGNPWIFGEIRHFLKNGTEMEKPTPSEKKEAIITHGEQLCVLKGEHTAILEMRKHISWYVKGLKGASELRCKINTIQTLGEMINLVDMFM